MYTFTARLHPGTKAPYTTWAFLHLSDELVVSWRGRAPFPVRGTLAGTPFRGTVTHGDGVWRMVVPRALREAAGLSLADPVEVAIELDPEPRPVDVPDELRAVLDEDADLASRFEALPPSHRRAWAMHVAEAKRPETRERRARQAVAGIRGRTFPGA